MDMDRMGSWGLEPFGIKLLTTNQAESWNATLKRLVRERDQTDSLVLALFEISQFFNRRVTLGAAGSGDYKILDSLHEKYQGLDPASLPKLISIQEIREMHQLSRKKTEELDQVDYFFIV